MNKILRKNSKKKCKLLNRQSEWEARNHYRLKIIVSTYLKEIRYKVNNEAILDQLSEGSYEFDPSLFQNSKNQSYAPE